MERLLLTVRGAASRPTKSEVSSPEAAVPRVAALLNSGGIAILPAEGLYGFHARPDLPAAVARLLAIKPREEGRGWIGLIAGADELGRYAEEPLGRARSLARKHWPGPLTLVVRASSSVPKSLVAGDGTVALRCPGSGFLRALARACGGILLSTSANAPGEPPPASAEGLGVGTADLVADAGPLSGVPSTLVRVEGDDLRILREGAVRIEGDLA